MSEQYKLKFYGKTYKLSLNKLHYSFDNSLAVELVEKNGEPFAVISVCVPEEQHTNENCIFVDTNNCPWATKFLEDNGLGKPTGVYAMSGWCTYPEYEISD